MNSEKTKETTKEEEKIAVILIRGLINSKQEVKDTLKMLRLYSKNNCSIIKKTASSLGMLNKVKDYVTWGEISAESESNLKKMNTIKEKTFKLHPPRGGFERKGIKKTYQVGGVLGYRGKEIKKLIEKMCG